MPVHRASPRSNPSSSSRALTLGLLLVLVAGCGREPAAPQATSQPATPSTHVGQRVCAECHERESALWMGSDHQRAMEPADRALGDFKNASLLYNGIRSIFTTDGNRLMARTDGPDGRMRDYQVAYTFGVTPLQQYLVAFPGGRYQALNVAWDTRPKAAGASAGSTCTPARRWITATCCIGPARRRTGTSCAPTATRRTCRSGTTRPPIATTRHGPRSTCRARRATVPGRDTSSGHASRRPLGRSDAALKGLVFTMKDTSGGHWMLPAGASIAQRTAPLSSRLEVETCARCHAQGRACVADVRARTAVGRHAPCRAAR